MGDRGDAREAGRRGERAMPAEDRGVAKRQPGRRGRRAHRDADDDLNRIHGALLFLLLRLELLAVGATHACHSVEAAQLLRKL